MSNKKKKKNNKEKNGKILYIKIAVLILAAAAYVAVIIFANQDRPHFEITDTTGTEYETAIVRDVLSSDTIIDDEMENVKKGSEEIEIEILTGRYKGDVVNITNYFSALYNVDVKEGQKLSVRIDTTGKNEYQVAVYNYNRIPLFYGLIIAFFLALILIGGKQGFKAFAGLAFTVVSILFILLPLSLKGFEMVPLTCAIVFVTSTVCYYLVGGWQPKTITAALGCFAGVLAAAIFGALAAKIAGITTFQTDEAEALMLVKSTFDLKMRGLFVSGILIAAMGAVMDVAMTIASALDEIHSLNPDRDVKQLFKSGMTIGRDAMGTMANTLVLAYVGSALNMMVLIYSYGVSFRQLVNTDFVAVEMIRAIAGSIGIFLSVPATAIIGAVLLTHGLKKKKI